MGSQPGRHTQLAQEPLGLCGQARQADVAQSAFQVQHTRQRSQHSILAAGAFAAIIRRLLDGMSLQEAVLLTRDQVGWKSGGLETYNALKSALEAAGEGSPSPERLQRLGEGWVAEEALAMSVYCALVHPDDVRAAVLLAVNHSGDSDSTGAITGNLLGAWLGEHALPRPWVIAAVLWKDARP
jgi:ADP-ribosylglycohydrolase